MDKLKQPTTPGASRLLADFEIVQTLGSGAFGLVCKLRSKSERMNYAVKVVPLLFEDSRDLREVQNLAKVPTHANVVRYVTCWQDCMSKEELERVKLRLGATMGAGKDLVLRMNRGQTHIDLLCIQMELCGEDLRRWLGKQRAVVESKSVQIFLQICAGLEHIHAHNLIHRDLKPENIFFSLEGSMTATANVKIGDLGLAIGHTAQMSAFHTRGAGTPLYWAPEQESTKYSQQADLYSLGLILFELFDPCLKPQPRAGRFGAELSYEPLIEGFKQLKFKNVLPPLLKAKYPQVAKLILSLVSVNPKERPSFGVIRETIGHVAQVNVKQAPTRPRPQPLSPSAVPVLKPIAHVKNLPLIPKLRQVYVEKGGAEAVPKQNGYTPVTPAAVKPVTLPIKVPVAAPRVSPVRGIDTKPNQPPLPLPRTVKPAPDTLPVPKQRVLPSKRDKGKEREGSDDEPCARCRKSIIGGEKLVQALGRVWHPEHFTCAHCQQPLRDGFFEKDDRAYCKKDYDALYLPKCVECKKAIEKGLVTVEGLNWHREHFCCIICHKAIGSNPYYWQEGRAYCKPDYLRIFAPQCPGCKKGIESKYIELSDPGSGVDKQKWHADCLTCAKCKKKIGGGDDKAYSHEGKLYCGPDYLKLWAPRCTGCKKPIEGKHVVLKLDPRVWHNECFSCQKCRKLIGDNYIMHQNQPICTSCHLEINLRKNSK